jgi:monomeric sarcosine oxidase
VTRVAVVGAGIAGAAAAWALAARGADVTVYEQYDLDHTRGSSHGRTRIVRSLYADPAWVRQAVDSMELWRAVEAESGTELLELYGIVELVPERSRGSAEALASCGVPHRLLDAEETRAYGAALPDGWTAVFQPDAGVILADRAREALLRGVRVETGRRVESPDELDEEVVVLTAGPWIGRLVPGLPLRVTRETVTYFRKAGPPIPSVVDVNETGGHSMFALHDPVHGVKAGVHHGGVDADPDEPGEPDPSVVERAAAWVAERLPDVDPEPVAAETCIYTTTPDETFVLERRGRVVVGSACSGHGFKFAPLVGRRLAELALG